MIYHFDTPRKTDNTVLTENLKKFSKVFIHALAGSSNRAKCQFKGFIVANKILLSKLFALL